MEVLVPLILAAMWAAVLLPPWLRSRNEGRATSIGSYHSTLAVLGRGARMPGRGGPLAVTGPLGPSRAMALRPRGMTLRQAQQRRRSIISGLLVAAAITLLLGGGVGALRPVLYVHVVVDAALIAYVGLLAQTRRVVLERAANVHFLPTAHTSGGGREMEGGRDVRVPAAAAGEPLLLLQRVGS